MQHFRQMSCLICKDDSNMKKIFIAAAALSAIVFVFGCGAEINLSGVKETRTHAVADNYTSLRISSAISAVLSADADSVKIIADGNVIDYVSVEQQDGKLVLSVKYPSAFGLVPAFGLVRDGFDVRAIVPCSPSLSKVKVSGASGLTADKAIEAGVLSVRLSGASSFSGEIIADTAHLVISGASDARLCGRILACDIAVSGASSLKGLDGNFLETDVADIDISGASSARFVCNDTLSGAVSGASSAICGGDSDWSVSTSGASSIKRK